MAVIYVRNKELVWENIGDETVILDHQQGRIWRLNETAGRIWALLRRRMEVDGLIKKLTVDYSGDRMGIEGGVVEILRKMEKEGLVLGRNFSGKKVAARGGEPAVFTQKSAKG